ncbi:hypothetical protein D3C72_523720 [compost metagenome]
MSSKCFSRPALPGPSGMFFWMSSFETMPSAPATLSKFAERYLVASCMALTSASLLMRELTPAGVPGAWPVAGVPVAGLAGVVAGVPVAAPVPGAALDQDAGSVSFWPGKILSGFLMCGLSANSSLNFWGSLV